MAENIALNLIDDNPYQTRQTYDQASLEELAADIAARGLLQPPVGRRVDGRVQLAFGHRRKRAFVLLAQEHPDYRHLPLEIRELSDEDMALCAWSENARRRDVSPVDEAVAIRRMMDTFGWTQRCTAERLGLSRPAVSNKLRLLRLPDEAREQVGRGALSERQALALLPVLELPEPAQERIRESWCKGQVQAIIDEPQDHSSTAIRRTVDDVLRHATADLAEAVFPLNEPVAEGREGVRSSRCDECEFRVRRGKGVLCGDVQCNNIKKQVWCDDYLAQVSEVLGVPVLTMAEKDGLGYSDYDYLYPNQEGQTTLAHAMDKQCPNLRIGYYANNYVLRPDGYDLAGYVCVHTGKRDCVCRNEVNRQAHAAEIAAEKERKRRLNQVKKQAVAQVSAALAEGQTGALKAVLTGLSSGSSRKKAATIKDHRTVVQRIACILVEGAARARDPDQADAEIEAWMERLGIDGAAPDPLAEVRRRWMRINVWMGKLTGERPATEAVRGNLANLLRLTESLDEVEDETGKTDETESHRDQIARAMETLSSIRPVVETWDGNGFDDVGWLVGVPAGDVNFRSSLEQATPSVLRYALALSRGREGNKTRVKALERRLRQLG